MNEPRQVSIRSVFTQCFTHVRRAPGQCAKPSPGKVSRSLHAASSRTWSVRTFRGSELCADGTQPGTHDRYAPADAYQHQVRTSGSPPPTRCWCEPGWRLPALVTRANGCQTRGFHCGFHAIAVFFYWPSASLRNNPMDEAGQPQFAKQPIQSPAQFNARQRQTSTYPG